MAWYEVLKWIAVMVLILGVLISLHELGHLITAKIFGVYCFDYSIGFGPALLHKKRKGGETYFSIRAVPLGGYVSMYGEPGAVPEGMEEPPAERSLNSIHKGKKMLILSAGIIVNFILGLTLIFISTFACAHYYYAYGGYSAGEGETSVTINYLRPTYSDQALSYLESVAPSESNKFIVPLLNYGSNISILDDEVYLVRADGAHLEDFPRVAVYYPSDLTSDQNLSSSIRLYPAAKNNDGSYLTPTKVHEYLGISYYPDVSDVNAYLSFSSSSFEGARFSLHPRFIKTYTDMKTDAIFEEYKASTYTPQDGKLVYEISSGKCVEAGVRVPVIKEWVFERGWSEGWAYGWKDFGNRTVNAITAIGQGFAMLFTPKGIENMSSVVGMTAALPEIASMGGVANIFYFAGLISINLAFFNFLPFPGLDGWQLLTTAVEGISRKKIPAKVQGIVSLVGIGLLLALGVFVIIKDIVGLFH